MWLKKKNIFENFSPSNLKSINTKHLLILQQSPVLVCLLFIKMGKRKEQTVCSQILPFKWVLPLACLQENSKWKHLVTGKCLRTWRILEKDISWPCVSWTLVQLEPSEHWKPRQSEGVREAVKACPSPDILPAKDTVQVTTPLPEQFNKKWAVSLLLASVLF